MGKYIDLEPLINALKTIRKRSEIISVDEVLDVLAKYPAADVAEVVRCKDCKYRKNEQPSMVYCPHMIGGWVGENWFCAGGKRRNE